MFMVGGFNPISSGWPAFGARAGAVVPPDTVPRHALQDYYDSGVIIRHIGTEFAEPAIGPVEVIRDKGNPASVLDAMASEPLPVDGPFMTMGDEAHLVLSQPIEFSDMRLMWVMSADSAANGMRYFGHVGSVSSEIRINHNGGATNNVLFQFWTNASGVGTASNVHPSRFTLPATGDVLVELEVTAADVATVHLNGQAVGGAGSMAGIAGRTLSMIGRGSSMTVPFTGRFGDVIAIRTGLDDTPAAITASRAYLATRFGLELAA